MTAMTDRQLTINRAIDLIDTATTDDLAVILAATDILDCWKTDPSALRHNLATAGDRPPGHAVGAWKAAQQILAAAGLPT